MNADPKTNAGSETAIRKAHLEDVGAMAALIGVFAARNDVLPRSAANIACSLRDFYVAEADGKMVGCCALAIVDRDLLEVRTLVVDESTQGRGVGRALVEACLKEAAAMGFEKIFALTRACGFFEKLGFVEVPMTLLPQKVWLDCVHCASFPDCDEAAMVWRG